MSRHPKQPDPHALLDELAAVLGSLLREHEALLDVTARHRQAIATADMLALRTVNEQQQQAAERMAHLERRRQQLAAALAPHAPEGAAGTLPALAAAFPHARDTLTALADRIRDVAGRLSREQRAVRIAAEALAEHMQGLMKQVARKLSHAGTYGRRGSVDARVQVTSALDLVT